MKSLLLLTLLISVSPISVCADSTDADSIASESGSKDEPTTERSADAGPVQCAGAAPDCYATGYEGHTFAVHAELIANGQPYSAEDVIKYSGWEDYREMIMPTEVWFRYAYE